MDKDQERTVRRMLDSFNERRWADFAEAYAGDAVVHYPQSGERFVGRKEIRAMVEAFPSPPTLAVTDVRGAGDSVVVEADADYGAGPAWKAVLLYTLAGDHVASETAYFAAPFEPADWRAPFRADLGP